MSYFKPLRRKVGVVTLVMACALTTAWVRSLIVHDVFLFNQSFDEGAIAGIATCQNDLIMMTYQFSDPSVGFGDGLPVYQHDVEQLFQFWQQRYESTATLLVIAATATPPPAILIPKSTFVLPFWSIVVPLTALSAYLLLSKPRARAAKEST